MINNKVGIIGSGVVGESLANGFLKIGFEVMRGSRETKKLEKWLARAPRKAHIGNLQETAAFAPLIVLAVKGLAAEEAVKLCGIDNLANKIVIDTTNPISDRLPQNGVLQFFTDFNESLMERLQRLAPKSNFVKAFSCVGSSFMIDPNFDGLKPSMFICGNNDAAKLEVRKILDQFGWEVEDMGAVESARAIEPLCILWCLPGFRENKWSHAFKLLKK